MRDKKLLLHLPALTCRDNRICGTSTSSHVVMHETNRDFVFVMSVAACSPHCKQCSYYPLLVSVLFAKYNEARFVSFVIYVDMTALRSWHGSASAPRIVVQ